MKSQEKLPSDRYIKPAPRKSGVVIFGMPALRGILATDLRYES